MVGIEPWRSAARRCGSAEGGGGLVGRGFNALKLADLKKISRRIELKPGSKPFEPLILKLFSLVHFVG